MRKDYEQEIRDAAIPSREDAASDTDAIGSRWPGSTTTAKVNVSAVLLVLFLNSPEYWGPLLPWWDIAALDYMAQGLLITTAVIWARYAPSLALAAVFGIARTGCAAIWPNASSTNAAICDQQTGLPLTLGVVSIVALAATWKHRRE